MRIGSSGDIMAGTTSEVQADSSGTGLYYDVSKGTLQLKASGNIPIVANRVASDGVIAQFRKDGTTVGSIGVSSSALTVATGDTGFRFVDAVDAIAPFSATTQLQTDNQTDIGRSSFRFKDLYLSGGVYLGGTGSANKLDDYEEGTFTPVLADASSGGNTASGTFHGTYTKVGRMVYCQLFLLNINKTGMTSGNALHLRGMPFTSNSSDAGGRANAAVRCDNINFTGYVMAAYGPNSTLLIFQDIIDSAFDISLTVASITSSGASDIFFDITYQTN
jgi:hypothetical protein